MLWAKVRESSSRGNNVRERLRQGSWGVGGTEWRPVGWTQWVRGRTSQEGKPRQEGRAGCAGLCRPQFRSWLSESSGKSLKGIKQEDNSIWFLFSEDPSRSREEKWRRVAGWEEGSWGPVKRLQGPCSESQVTEHRVLAAEVEGGECNDVHLEATAGRHADRTNVRGSWGRRNQRWPPDSDLSNAGKW